IYASELPELAFRTPEASHPEHRLLQTGWEGSLEAMPIDEMLWRHSHSRRPTRQRVLFRWDSKLLEHGIDLSCAVQVTAKSIVTCLSLPLTSACVTAHTNRDGETRIDPQFRR